MKRALGLGLLSGLMALSVTPAFATDGGTQTELKDDSVTVTKTLELPNGASSVPNETFSFTATSSTDGAPRATIEDMNFSGKSLGLLQSDNKYHVQETKNINFATAFPHAGRYVYEVKETAGKTDNMTYDNKVYTMTVDVANKSESNNDLYIKEIKAQNDNNQKVDNIDFTNTYVKKSKLTISKTVTGDYGDHTKDFTFTIRFNKNPFDTAGNYTANKNVKDGSTETTTVEAGKDYTFTLHHNENIEFNNLPVGTTYTVTETKQDGYTPSIKVNGGTVTDNNGQTGTQTVQQDDNTVEYTNTEDSITVTGVVINNLPYILLAGLGVIGCALLAVFKRRKLSK